MDTTTIQIRQRGSLTLPINLREKYGIKTGDSFQSEYGASLVVLRMAEITLINAITSQQAITEAERNLADKIPAALPAFQRLVQRCLRVAANPKPADLMAFQGMADEKDLPILAMAVREQCAWLLTFNLRDF